MSKKHPFHANLRALREARGLTQKQVAFVFGMRTMAISNWETGRSWPHASYLPRLARLLEASLADLFGEAA